MAWVILSAGTLAQSKVRTLSLRRAVAIVSVFLLTIGAGAFALGLGMGRQSMPPPIEEVTSTPAENHFLIDRVAELSGRLVRLENDAQTLAKRINLVKDFEKTLNDRPKKDTSVYEGSKPNTPAGGPLIALPEADSRAIGPKVSQDLEDKIQIDLDLTLLEQDLERLHAKLAIISHATDQHNLLLMAFPSRHPVPGAPRSSAFGRRLDPFHRHPAFHSGVDFPAPSGTAIVASAGGRVIYAGYRKDYGYTVEIDHGNKLITRYAHCSMLIVKTGDVVAPGQHIAAVGSTGRSTGPHLHFEVLKSGRYSNPDLYLSHS